jgi:hypothetical protein
MVAAIDQPLTIGGLPVTVTSTNRMVYSMYECLWTKNGVTVEVDSGAAALLR